MTRYIIDRIEDGLAVLEREDDEFITMPIDDLPGRLRTARLSGMQKRVLDD